MPPRELAGAAGRGARRDGRHRVGRDRRPRVPQHPGRGRRAGRRRGRRSSRRARRTARSDVLSRPAVQRGVHLRQPDRPAPPRPHPVGRRRRRDRPGARGRGRRRSTREFYINDRGNQMDKFGASLEAAAPGPAGPRGRLPRRLHRRPRRSRSSPTNPHIVDLPEGERLAAFREAGYKLQLAEQQEQLAGVPDALRRLVLRAQPARGAGATRSSTGSSGCASRATCSRPTARCGCAPPTSATTRTGCCVRSNGELTYFASDTAYYVDKRERGFDVCIYLLGADHHGYVGRLQGHGGLRRRRPRAQHRGADRPAGEDPARRRGGPAVSKRAGTIVTLQELVDMIGVDAAALHARRATRPTRPLTLDVEEITRQATTTRSSTCSTPTPGCPRSCATPPTSGWRRPSGDAFDPALLAHEKEGDLLRALAEFPRVVAAAAQLREPHRVARYLEDTAVDVPQVLRRLPGAADGRRGAGTDPPGPAAARRRRPARCSPTASRLLGVSAPERM